jgi:hypothetical protein
MAITDTNDYEKLGVFYLGRHLEPEAKTTSAPTPLLYQSKDLTTHAVIIGMTGSGKTGLGIGLLEEAAIDKIPVIAIDPKGDLGNLMLNFPNMQGEDLEPWVDPQTAVNQGMSGAEYAHAQAKMWRKGLNDWDQSLERIQALRDAAEVNIYTPGSSAGIPISVLKSFAAPSAALRDDRDAYTHKIQASASSLLSLLSIDADPLTSREHILIANILQHSWDRDESLDIPGLINAIQTPPMSSIGVMNIDSFYPAKDRFGLAMRLNGLLASPGFASWMQGVPLDAKQLFYTDNGKPRISVMSIAHLNDTERMFFVTMLLSEIISWMRAQPGTPSLRAILYMDEIFGYMPPTANPPSKALMLLLLKQARAFGLGVVLSTQNPVDLDYKGLSNTGTWFIGRLQTDRDKQRVLDGLLGASSGGEPMNKQDLERRLSSLDKRQFLLHNVNAGGHLAVFNSRWVLSYLAGPLSREQIKRLSETAKVNQAAIASPNGTTATHKILANKDQITASAKPSLPPEIEQYFQVSNGPAPESDSHLYYRPTLVAAADILYRSVKHKVDSQQQLLMSLNTEASDIAMDWQDGEVLAISLKDLQSKAESGAQYQEASADLSNPKNHKQWQTLFKRHIRTNTPICLYRCTELKMSSEAGESEADFRIRLQTRASEDRDLASAKLQDKYATKFDRLEERIRKAEQRIEKEQSQASQQKLDTVLSIGSSLLGALFGGRKSTSARRAGSAMSKANRIRKESQDVENAEENAEILRLQLQNLEAELKTELAEIEGQFDAQKAELEEISIRATSSNIHLSLFGVLWQPYWKTSDGFIEKAC